MRPTDILRAEHDTIKQGLEVLGVLCMKLKKKQKVDPDLFARLIRFFREYADARHHAKEEEMLFTAIRKAGIPRAEALCGTLMTHHFLAREFVAAMADQTGEYRKGKRGAAGRLCEEANAYITLLKIHICDEDHILFSLAEKKLTTRQQSSLLKRFLEFDARPGLAGRHQTKIGALHRQLVTNITCP